MINSTKNKIFYAAVLLLLVLFLWQWLSNGALMNQAALLQKYNSQMQLLAGIGQVGSTHIHADIQVYINGNAIDFSQKKYQLATSFIHFEDGIGNVIHVHATGMTLGHLFKSLRMDLDSSCIAAEGRDYCNENSNKLKIYVNGRMNSQFDNYVIRDLDKILVSYGNESDLDIKKQMDSITSLAPRYSLMK